MINIDINRQKDCFNAIRDFDKNGGKTYQVTQDDITAIQDRWGEAKVQRWRQIISQASQDVVNYQLTDDETDEAYNAGKQDIEDRVGYERTAGKNAAQIGGTIASGGGALVSGAAGIVNAVPIVTGAAAKIGVGEGAKSVGGVLGKSGGIIGCAIAVANVALYLLRNPNKKEADALKEMQTVMDEAGNNTANAQADMEMLAANIEAQSQEAEDIQADHQEEIYKGEDTYVVQNKIHAALQEKIDSGGQLTEEEKMAYDDSGAIMAEAGKQIKDNDDAAEEEVGDIAGDIETSLEDYDTGAETIADTQAKIDVSASFDQKTEDCANTEKWSQTIGGISAFASAAKALGEGIPGYIAAAAGVVAGGAQMGFATQQAGYSEIAAQEIDKRTSTDKLNQASSETYETNLETSVGDLEYVKDGLDTETPDDVPTDDSSSSSEQTTVQQPTDSGLLVPPEEEENEEA